MAEWTDDHIAEALEVVDRLERGAREGLGTEDVAERDEYITMVRHTLAVRRQLEGWMGRRAVRRRSLVGGR